MSRGKFITVEGVEGVGKSTHISLISAELESRDIEVLLTREPGGTGTGERIRNILLDKDEQGMTALTELLLMFAARSQHVEEVVLPALEKGIWVVSDRFTDSSYAYQGAGRGLGDEVVASLENIVLGQFRPDLTLILDVDVQEGLQRAASVGEADRFESEQVDFFESVRAAFLGRANADPRYHVVDASQSIAQVQLAVRQIIGEFVSAD